MAQYPSASPRTVGLVVLAALLLSLVVFLVITWVQGDTTNHLGDQRPPDKTPSSTFPTATSS